MTLELMRSQRKIAFIAAFVCAVGSALAQGTIQTVVPLGFENQNGNGGDGILSRASHLQQLFRASYLATEWRTPVAITGVAFRVTDGTASYSAVIPRIEIRLSTSSRSPDNMALLYASNKGVDESTVYLHDNVQLFGSVRTGVNPFDLQFIFDKPFVYDSTKGSLLMYMDTGSPTPGASQIDSHFLSGNEASYVGNSAGFGDNQIIPYSLVAQFSWTAVPEPSALSLVGLAFACLAANSLRRRSFHPTR